MKVIFIPGNGGGGPNDNWFPYLKDNLEALNVQIIASEFPDAILAREAYWIPIEEARFVHQKLNSEYYESFHDGHFGGDSEKLTFPELFQALKAKLVEG